MNPANFEDLGSARETFNNEVQLLKDSINKYLKNKVTSNSQKFSSKDFLQESEEFLREMRLMEKMSREGAKTVEKRKTRLNRMTNSISSSSFLSDFGDEDDLRNTRKSIESMKFENESDDEIFFNGQSSLNSLHSEVESYVFNKNKRKNPKNESCINQDPRDIRSLESDTSFSNTLTLKEIEESFEIESSSTGTSIDLLSLGTDNFIEVPSTYSNRIVNKKIKILEEDISISKKDPMLQKDKSLSTQTKNSKQILSSININNPTTQYTSNTQNTQSTSKIHSKYDLHQEEIDLSQNEISKPLIPPLHLNVGNKKSNSSQSSQSSRSKSTTPKRNSILNSSRSGSVKSRRSIQSSLLTERRKPLQNFFSSDELVSIISKTLCKSAKEQNKNENQSSYKSPRESRIKRKNGLEQIPNTLNFSSILSTLPHEKKSFTENISKVSTVSKTRATKIPSKDKEQKGIIIKNENFKLADELLKKRGKVVKEQRFKLKESGKLSRNQTVQELKRKLDDLSSRSKERFENPPHSQIKYTTEQNQNPNQENNMQSYLETQEPFTKIEQTSATNSIDSLSEMPMNIFGMQHAQLKIESNEPNANQFNSIKQMPNSKKKVTWDEISRLTPMKNSELYQFSTTQNKEFKKLIDNDPTLDSINYKDSLFSPNKYLFTQPRNLPTFPENYIINDSTQIQSSSQGSDVNLFQENHINTNLNQSSKEKDSNNDLKLHNLIYPNNFSIHFPNKNIKRFGVLSFPEASSPSSKEKETNSYINRINLLKEYLNKNSI